MKRKIVLFTLSMLLLGLTGCKKNETEVTPEEPLPQFDQQKASKINEISYESAKITIALSGTGTSPLKSFGLVYSETETQPKTSTGNREEYTVPAGTTNPKTSLMFVMDGLKPNTTYYVRPFATNGNGTAYGEVFVVTTKAVTYRVKVYLGTYGDDLGGGKVWVTLHYRNGSASTELKLKQNDISPGNWINIPGREDATGEMNAIPNSRLSDLVGVTVRHDGSPSNFWETYNNWDLWRVQLKMVDPENKETVRFEKNLSPVLRFTGDLKTYRWNFL